MIAEESVKAHRPDLAILDIRMPLGAWAGGVGYLPKDRCADVERLLEAARRVAEGGSALDPEVVAHLLGRRENGGSSIRSPPASAR